MVILRKWTIAAKPKGPHWQMHSQTTYLNLNHQPNPSSTHHLTLPQQ